MSDILECTVTGRIARAPGVESFRLAPPREVPFLPGQYVQVLFDPTDRADRNLNKFLSLSCAPGLPYLEVTKKLSASAFSERLRALRPGDALALRGPFGACVLRPEERKVAFLVGGIGITPVISMVEHAARRRLDLAMELFYSSRSESQFAFKPELEAWAAALPHLALHLFLTAGAPRDARITAGRITVDRLREALPEPASWVAFVFGPPAMVAAMKADCLEIGIPEPSVRTEGFTGY